MFGSPILDVAIGISFVYLFLSLICSVVNEGISAVLALRSKNLVKGIDDLFSGCELETGKSLVGAIYAHGLIRGLYKDPSQVDSPDASASTTKLTPGQIMQHMPVMNMIKETLHVNLPAYIPSGIFATALIDVISPSSPDGPRSLSDVREAINNLPPSAVRQALLCLAADTQKDVAEFQTKVETWFNDSMDRAAGLYKRRAQQFLLAIALVVTLVLNVDTIKLAESLWTNPITRQATVDLAQQYVTQNKNGPSQLGQNFQQAAQSLQNMGQQIPFPFGWSQRPPLEPLPLLETLVGWIITTLALSLGAPFWFDTLNKFMVVRSTVKPREKSQPEDSKDN